jgi:uncharacterized delta-60 repeat protein
VTGYSANGNNQDYATIKYNSAGVQQWAARYNGPGNSFDQAYSLAVDGSGNVYVTGRSMGSAITFDYATIKYNSAGVQQWASRYDGPGNGADEAYSLAVDVLGNIYVTGESSGIGTDFDYATIKYNSAGVSQWVARYDAGNGADIAYSLAVDGLGNVYVTGGSNGSGTQNDYATIKYTTLGVQQWAARYDGPANGGDEAHSIAVDGTGNVYVTGYSTSVTNYDYATIKYNSIGAQQWLARYNGTGNFSDWANSLAVDGSGNVYVTGYSAGTPTNDYVTIKYSETIGITPISNVIPEKYSLSQNFPNPFNPATNIRFDIQKNGLVSLKVYDILGRVVSTLINGSLQPGTYEANFDASGITSGVYFYKLEANGFSDVKRMVLIK